MMLPIRDVRVEPHTNVFVKIVTYFGDLVRIPDSRKKERKRIDWIHHLTFYRPVMSIIRLHWVDGFGGDIHELVNHCFET